MTKNNFIYPRFYLIDTKNQLLGVFDTIDSLTTFLWGAYIPRYILVVSTLDGDFVEEIINPLDELEKELNKKYAK